MKKTSIEPYLEIMGKKGPELHYLALLTLMNAERPLNQHEVHDRVARLRPSAYASIRSRIGELELAGLVLDTGQTNTKGTLKKSKCVTYRISPRGVALMQTALPDIAMTLKKTMKKLHSLCAERRDELKPIRDRYAALIKEETRAIIDEDLAR